MLCKYYEKLLCCKSDLPACFSSHPHSSVCLFVWRCVSADEHTLKLFPFLLCKKAVVSRWGMWGQHTGPPLCLLKMLPTASQLRVARTRGGTGKGRQGQEGMSGKLIWTERIWCEASWAGTREPQRYRGGNDEAGACWLMNDCWRDLLSVNTAANDTIRCWRALEGYVWCVCTLVGFLSALGMGDGYRHQGEPQPSEHLRRWSFQRPQSSQVVLLRYFWFCRGW